MIFIDSTYFIGLFLPRDAWHGDSETVRIDENEKLVINNLVLSEVLNIVSKRSQMNIQEVYNEIKENVKIVCLSNDDYLKAIDYCIQYKNTINYSDCLILVTMKNLGINKIVSFDSGFKRVPGLEVVN